MAKVEEKILPLASEVASSLGLSVYDIEYVREGGEYYLRIYIDKDGGVSLDDCEAFNDAVNPPLDKLDPISEAYILEVSSPGIERKLRTDAHFNGAIGETVELKFFAPVDGQKSIIGELKAFDSDTVTVGEMTVARAKIANAKVHFDF